MTGKPILNAQEENGTTSIEDELPVVEKQIFKRMPAMFAVDDRDEMMFDTWRKLVRSTLVPRAACGGSHARASIPYDIQGRLSSNGCVDTASSTLPNRTCRLFFLSPFSHPIVLFAVYHLSLPRSFVFPCQSFEDPVGVLQWHACTSSCAHGDGEAKRASSTHSTVISLEYIHRISDRFIRTKFTASTCHLRK